MSGWVRPRRALLALLAAGGLLLFVWLSVQVYRSKQDPEHYRAWDGPLAWILGPPAGALEDAAQERLRTGLAHLQDTSRPAAERIRLYRGELRRAEALLVRSLRAQPAQAHALAALAAVRWELDPPRTPAASRERVEMIDLAARMAPTYPEVQQEVGELLLKMGRRAEALRYLARAVELEPSTGREVVRLLEEYLFSADEILAGLPSSPSVLVHLERSFAGESRDQDYLGLLETALARPEAEGHPALLKRYAGTCLGLDSPERLLDRLDALGRRMDRPFEAERLHQRARALMAMGRHAAAVTDASAARDLEPNAPGRAELLGDAQLAAGDAEASATAYRAALHAMARAREGPQPRARLYRKLGQSEERGGRPDRAYDAYRKAVELKPDERIARERLDSMERAAGFD